MNKIQAPEPIIDFIVKLLITPANDRKADLTNDWPDYDANPYGFDSVCVDELVLDALINIGWFKIGINKTKGIYLYKNTEEGASHFLLLSKDFENYSFNPYNHLHIINIDPIDSKFIEGNPLGLI